MGRDSMETGRGPRWTGVLAAAVLGISGGVGGTGCGAVANEPPPPARTPADPGSGTAAGIGAAAAASPAEAMARLAAVGASVTHGFYAQMLVEAGGRMQTANLDLADALAAVLGGDGQVEAAGSEWFFTDPDRWGPELLQKAEASRPTSVVAVDFLFWFGYGSTGHRPGTDADAAARHERLERGLALLSDLEDRIPGHLLVGDLPDMSGAVGRMLSASQVPDEATRRSLNARIAAWVDERPTAILVPLSDTMRGLLAGERFGVPEEVPLLKPDRLHPTADGLVVVAREVVSRLIGARGPSAAPEAAADHEAAVVRLRARLAARIEAAAREDAPAGAGAS